MDSGPEKRLYASNAVPSKYSSVFPHPFFNALQSQCLYDLWYTQLSLVVAAPTGSGKTGLLELAICRAIEDHGSSVLAVYIAPTKSLVRERVLDWKSKFSPIGVVVKEVTGDEDSDLIGPNVNLICTTPEKWDSQSRSRSDLLNNNRTAANLYLIDEIHLVGDPCRGPVLEAVLTRRIVRPNKGNVHPRFVAVSATIPNADDIGQWLGRSTECKVHHYDESNRSSSLDCIIKGYPCPSDKNAYAFDIGLDYKLPNIIQEYALPGKLTLIFVSTRNAAVGCARRLAKAQAWVGVQSTGSLMEIKRNINDKKLADIIGQGVAYHHAGLSTNDRSQVERAFLNGQIRVLVATTTLSTGVNFPAYLVIVRGTTMYNGGSTSEYPLSRIQQMIGRAGRVQFESAGKAFIMTKQQHVPRYQAMLDGKLEDVESYLQLDLIRHLNSEIVFGNITSCSAAIDWFMCTFFYVRLKKVMLKSRQQDDLEALVQDQVRGALAMLESNGLISTNGKCVFTTDFGRIFGRFCMTFRGFSMVIEALRAAVDTKGLTKRQLMTLVSTLPDFENAGIRVGEKTTLKKLNSLLRHELTEKSGTWKDQHKIFILIESQLNSQEIMESTNLRIERSSLMKVAARVFRCLYEAVFCLWTRKDLRESTGLRISFRTLKNIALLNKSIHCGLWYDSQHCLQQLDDVGKTRGLRLIQNGIDSFDKLRRADPRIVELVTQTTTPFGSRLIAQAENNIPKYIVRQDATGKRPQVSVKLGNAAVSKEQSPALLLIGDEQGKIIFGAKINHNQLLDTYEASLTVSDWSRLTVCLINETVAGVDVFCSLMHEDCLDFEEVMDFEPVAEPQKQWTADVADCNRWIWNHLQNNQFEQPDDELEQVIAQQASEFLERHSHIFQAPETSPVRSQTEDDSIFDGIQSQDSFDEAIAIIDQSETPPPPKPKKLTKSKPKRNKETIGNPTARLNEPIVFQQPQNQVPCDKASRIGSSSCPNESPDNPSQQQKAQLTQSVEMKTQEPTGSATRAEAPQTEDMDLDWEKYLQSNLDFFNSFS